MLCEEKHEMRRKHFEKCFLKIEIMMKIVKAKYVNFVSPACREVKEGGKYQK